MKILINQYDAWGRGKWVIQSDANTPSPWGIDLLKPAVFYV